ncbi:hypothetical protein F2P81_023877 [Scophthalmus maximus]|uniref:Bromo adjacent-likey domain-containing 1 protein n=1 Tax=Scophthalmus maximus TaxID=52904 RepID=A0A6A4RSI1_SCOMX|nr:hypothetical protein F2P81_023877 [Scophthalmus maximus]
MCSAEPTLYGSINIFDCPVEKHVMTHARQKGSLRQSRSSAEWSDNCPLWPHGGTMGGAWPERSLRFGRTKKICDVIKQGKDRGKKMTQKRERREKSDQNRKLDRRRDKKLDRKLYPLRGRAGGSGEEGLSCHVLLTRLEESIREKKSSEERESHHPRQQLSLKLKPKPKKGKRNERREAKNSPKNKSKSVGPSHGDCIDVLQPRKRRLASLNAEAVNSLLLERATDPQPAAKQAKRQEEPTNGRGSPHADSARSGVPGGLKASRGPKASRGVSKVPTSPRLELCQSSKMVRKAKVKRGEESGEMSQERLDAPAPRRLAGLNAAALLKLTSSSATSKQRLKASPTATITSDCKAPTAVSAPKQDSRVKLGHKGRPQKQKGKKAPSPHTDCTACKEKADFESKVDWETNSCTHRLTKPGYQSRSMLAYPLKQVKEEQLETELSPYYCCPPEGSVEYCHRLAFFLGQQPYGESNEQPINTAMTPVKRECLVTSPSLTHSHPHTALTLSPHPCLCTADHCFSSYYVHIAHPTHTGTTSPALASRPLNFAPSSLCPNRMRGPKLLGSRLSNASGLAHPAYCNSVASPCYGDACGVNGYTYRAMPPVTSRGCSFSTGCTGCTHSIKTGRTRLPQKQPSTVPSLSSTKQKKISRRRATNGWRPVGIPSERDVFIANEIFASRHQDENSVACIEDRCYVLPLAQYCRFCALVKRRAEGVPSGSASMVPCCPEFAPPSHRCVPTDVDPELVYLCRHVYDFRYGRILKNLQ